MLLPLWQVPTAQKIDHYLPKIKINLCYEEEKYPSSYYRGKRHIISKLGLKSKISNQEDPL